MNNKIEEIKQALEVATPGPWKWSVKNRTFGDGYWYDNEFAVGDLAHPLDDKNAHCILDVQTNKWGQPMIYCWNEGAADLIAKTPEYIAYLLSEYDRLIAGYEVLASSELTLHPSELRDFSKKILKGQKPYEL